LTINKMNNKLTIWAKLVSSFDNSADGFSARKLSAFTAVIVALVATFKYVDNNVIINTLMVWLVFALLCLGIITAEQILKFYKKDADKTSVPPKEEESNDDPKI